MKRGRKKINLVKPGGGGKYEKTMIQARNEKKGGGEKVGKERDRKKREEQKKNKTTNENERWTMRIRKKTNEKDKNRTRKKDKKSRDGQLTTDANRNQSPLYLLSINTSEGRPSLPEKRNKKKHIITTLYTPLTINYTPRPKRVQ